MNEITLKINDIEYGGWKSLRVDLSMDQMAGAFGFNVTDRFPGHISKWPLKMGDECEVVLNGYIIANGYIDQINRGYDATSNNIEISGRDKTADLIDCSFVGSANEWKKLTIAQIIRNLCTPFGIDVTIDQSVSSDVSEIIRTFKANEGDSVSDLIINLCRKKAILPISIGDGKLTLTRVGTKSLQDTLVVGENIKAGSLIMSNIERFSQYIVKGQGAGSPELQIADFAQPTGGQTDQVVTRYRPIVILNEQAATTQNCRTRARWEARNRAGRTRSVNYILQGWTQKNGIPWKINSLIEIKDDILGINDKWVISQLSFTLDESTQTSMVLVHPTTYELLATPVIQQDQKIGFDPNRVS